MKLFKRKETKKCTYSDHPTKLGKVWHFLIHEDSWQSFLVDAILIILIGKFLIYPAIGLAMGTSYPLVAVMSGSMDHGDGSFYSWWERNDDIYEQFNISKTEFNEFQLKEGFSKGDVLVVMGKDFEDLRVGDVIVYKVQGKSDPLIHRIVQVEPTFVQTKGDANVGQLDFEYKILPEQIQGKAIALVPYVGWVKVGLLDALRLS